MSLCECTWMTLAIVTIIIIKRIVVLPEVLLFSQIVLVESPVHTQTVPSPFEHSTTENPRRLDQPVKLYHPQL